jgi:hypothetical protein
MFYQFPSVENEVRLHNYLLNKFHIIDYFISVTFKIKMNKKIMANNGTHL